MRILKPDVQIQPGFSQYRLNLDNRHARVLFINSISLLPGTLSVDLEGDYLELHLLDMRQDPVPQMQQLEHAIRRMFNLATDTGHG